MAFRKPIPQRTTGSDRITWVSWGIVFFVGAIVVRLFYLQVINHGLYAALAEGQYAIFEKLLPERGEIYFRDATSPNEVFPLVANREKRLVYAVPKQVVDPAATAEKVSGLLDLDAAVVQERLEKPNDAYEPIKHGVDVDVVDTLDALRLPGIGSSPELTRYYPFGPTAGSLTGFLGYDGDARVGQYGLEGYFEKQLAGEQGRLRSDGGDGRLLSVGRQTIQEARDGDSFLLTIDRTVQQTACDKLADAVQKHGARGGQVIIIKPNTGAILAMCSEPTYDPNTYNEVESASVYRNGAIFDEYEPGSVMKAMTLAGAIDQGLITPETTYEDLGNVQIGKYTIRNADNKKYGVQTINQVLEQSINTGAIFAVQKLGSDRFREYIERFGFGAKTDVSLQGESDGDVSALSKKGDIYSATASFGQGFSVTPMQLVMAFAAVANDGKLLKPHIVDSVIKPNGFHETVEPEVVRQVIKPETARTIKAMLVNVVRNGHGQRAGVPGYYVGGKTGTAQVPYGDRPGYDPNKNIGTFVGFAPLNDPAFVMLAKIDIPKDVRFAESSAAPLFGDLASFLLNYYQVPPDDENR